jgi:phosphopantothenoylcysteine decarboxylase/phosphopantothenate--cysteine ligase
MIVANLAQAAIGADDNEVMLLDDSGTHKLARAPKDAVARDIVAHLTTLYKARKKSR